MTKTDKKSDKSGLVGAAEALDAELRRYEGFVEALGRTALSSQKALERAAATLKEVADCDDRLGLRARELIDAITAAREKQQAQAHAVHARAIELSERVETWKELMRSYEGLSQDAASVNALIQTSLAPAVQSRKAEGGAPDLGEAAIAGLEEAHAKLGSLAEAAEALAARAQDKGFPDVAREADAVRQQLLAARNKLGLLRKKTAQA
ncbi:MAG: hypothetical protein HUU21_05755 [Polyangiaceae bacterium]|nr:hypothetical protein [Polyangiaceae bacterium]